MSDRDLFLQVLKQSGIATTLEEHQANWEKILVDNGYAVKNDSPQSPFWRAQKALIGEPALEISDFLVDYVMPNMFIKLAKNDWLNLHGDSRNVERLPAVKTQGNLIVSRADSSGEFVLEKGTIVQSEPINGVVYGVETLFDLVLVDGQSEGIIIAQALKDGSDYNLVAGYYNRFVTPIEGVNVINLDNWIVRAGQNVESNNSYRQRQKDAFAKLGDFHVDAVYRSIIAEFPGVLSDNVIFEHTAPRGPGSANAYVFLEVGQISQAVVDSINNHIAKGFHGHGDDLLVFAIPTQPQSITLDYWLHANARDVRSEVEQCIRAAFRENGAYKVTTCKPLTLFSFSKLATEIHSKFPEIESLKFENDDISVGIWLPVINQLAVNNHE